MEELIGGKYGVLTEGQVAKVHQAALEVLKRVGLRVESEEFLKIYGDGGTGGAAVQVLDLETGEARATTLQDQAGLARLAENLENARMPGSGQDRGLRRS